MTSKILLVTVWAAILGGFIWMQVGAHPPSPSEKEPQPLGPRRGTMWSANICKLCGKVRDSSGCTNSTCPNYRKE